MTLHNKKTDFFQVQEKKKGNVRARRLFLQNHVYAHDCSQNQLTDLAVMRNLLGDFQHVVICRSKEFLAHSGPFLGHVSELDSVIGNEPEVPTRPFSLQGTNGIILSVHQGELSPEGKKLLLKTADSLLFLVENADFGKKKRDPTLDSNHGISLGRLDLNIEWGHPLVIGETQNFGKKTKFFLPAVENRLAAGRLENIVIVGSLQKAHMFLHEKGVLIENWVHAQFIAPKRKINNIKKKAVNPD